jgi:chaperonin GroEL
MEMGLAAATEALRTQARAIDGPAEIARCVSGSLHDAELAELIGEVVDAVGPDGAVIVEDAPGTATVHEYVEGIRWNEGFVSTFLLKQDETTSTRLHNPRILITDCVLERAEQLVPCLEACVAAGDKSLLIIAPETREAVVGMLVANRERGVLESAVVVKAPSFGELQAGILEDIAVMTGGRVITQQRGQRLEDVSTADLGRARHAWATRLAFGILGGAGSKDAIRERIGEVKAQLRLADQTDAHSIDMIKQRIGKLAGTAAIIRVGGRTLTEQQDRKLRIEAAVKSARAAMQDGVLPGGGAALLACQAALDDVACGDEAFGVSALRQALAEPMRAIVRNAGVEDGAVLAHAAGCRDTAFDVLQEQWVDAFATGLVDPLAVTQAALEGSVSAAMTALTAEVLVHRKEPPMVMQP